LALLLGTVGKVWIGRQIEVVGCLQYVIYVGRNENARNDLQ